MRYHNNKINMKSPSNVKKLVIAATVCLFVSSVLATFSTKFKNFQQENIEILIDWLLNVLRRIGTISAM